MDNSTVGGGEPRCDQVLPCWVGFEVLFHRLDLAPDARQGLLVQYWVNVQPNWSAFALVALLPSHATEGGAMQERGRPSLKGAIAKYLAEF